MNLLPRYARLPISPPLAAIALLVLVLMIWVQGGVASMYQHLYLLIGSYLTWGLMLPFIQGLAEAIQWKKASFWLVGVFHMAVIILLHFLLSNVIYYTLQWLLIANTVLPDMAEVLSFLGPALLSRLFDFVLFFGLLSWANQSRSLVNQKLQLAQAEARLQRSKLDSLRGQLNPHFLFNTMHAIAATIGTDDEKARDITIKVSSLLRKTLKANEAPTHSMGQELELVSEYLELEKERFGDRLLLNLQLDPATSGFAVPTMCLQPIIENAFKHGVAVVEGQTQLDFSVKLKDEWIEVTITNDLATDRQSLIPSNGIGLANLQERLQLHYGDRYTLDYGQRDGRFVTQLKLPAK